MLVPLVDLIEKTTIVETDDGFALVGFEPSQISFDQLLSTEFRDMLQNPFKSISAGPKRSPISNRSVWEPFRI